MFSIPVERQIWICLFLGTTVWNLKKFDKYSMGLKSNVYTALILIMLIVYEYHKTYSSIVNVFNKNVDKSSELKLVDVMKSMVILMLIIQISKE